LDNLTPGDEECPHEDCSCVAVDGEYMGRIRTRFRAACEKVGIDLG